MDQLWKTLNDALSLIVSIGFCYCLGFWLVVLLLYIFVYVLAQVALEFKTRDLAPEEP